MNEAKTRLQKRGSRQEVTGLIVSDKVNVTRKYTEEIRNILFIWGKYGLTTAYQRFIPHYKKEKGHVKHGEPVLEHVIEGKLLYLKMVKGERDSTYHKLKERFDTLMNFPTTGDAEKTQNIATFEKLLDTEVIKKKSNSGKYYACFMLSGEKQKASISPKAIEENLDKLEISLCENMKKERFYFIHKPHKKKAEEGNSKQMSLDELLAAFCNSNFDLSIL